jgi:cystathionine beta-lyase/cystathionine gamma-synthase
MTHNPATSAVHAGGRRRPGEPPAPGAAAVTPIHREVITEFASAEEFAEVMADSRRGFLYSRIRDPNTDELATAVAELEGAEAGHCFASGMAAITAGLDLLAPPGTRIVAARQLYGQTYAVLRGRGDTVFCDLTDHDAITAALDGAGLLYVETVANPQIDVADLPALSRLAHDAGAALMVDNTVATPLGCRPLDHGADLVIHAATKFLNGHADALAGVAVGSHERIAPIAERSLDTGATLSPDSAWLVRRGMRTLHLRLERCSANALGVAAMLADHPDVTRVRYPGLPDDPSFEVAQRVLMTTGGLLSFDVAGGADRAMAVMNACRLCLRATSFGGVESSISHPAGTSHRQLDDDELAAAGLNQGTLRLSVGVEHVDDITADLDAALRA